jgi:vacuolar protein-sorting-associated protein 4
LFKKAREHKPSIIFIDEIEAMGGTRDDGGGENKHLSGLKTEFLVQMDGVGNDVNGVLVLAATNLPWKLDPALRRRFQRRIHIGLPDTKARTKMFEIGVGDTPCDLNPKDYEKMGEMTKGFSGSDISGVTQDALMVPVKKITAAKHFREVLINHLPDYVHF